MMISRVLLALGVAVATAAGAAPVRLDDSASPRARIDAQPRWLHTGEGLTNPELINAMVAEVANLEVDLMARYALVRPLWLYLRYDAALLFHDGTRDGQNTGTVGIEAHF